MHIVLVECVVGIVADAPDIVTGQGDLTTDLISPAVALDKAAVCEDEPDQSERVCDGALVEAPHLCSCHDKRQTL